MQFPRFRQVWPLVLAVGAAGWMAGCGKDSAAASQAQQVPTVKPIPVTIAPAKMIEIQRSVRMIGDLVALERVTLSNRVTGTVNLINYDSGAEVLPFDPANKVPLLTIEPKRYEMQLIQARQDFNTTLSKLGIKKLAVKGDDHPIKDWVKEVPVEETAPFKKAQSELETAQKKFEGAKPLHDAKLIHDFEFADYENAIRVAQSNIDLARNEAQALIAQAQGEEAVIVLRQKDFDDASIYPPGNIVPDAERTKIARYWVVERKVAQGEYLKEGTPLFVLEADDPIRFHAKVPERYLARLSKGNKIEFEVENLPGITFTGEVRMIDASVNPMNRTFTVEALVKNEYPAGAKVPAGANAVRPLRGGQFGKGRILVPTNGKEKEARLCVPFNSVVTFAGESKIYVAPQGEAGKPVQVRQVVVETGEVVSSPGPNGEEMQWIEVTPTNPRFTVSQGDLVVVDGITRVGQGTTVLTSEMKPPASQPGTETSPAK